MPHNSKFVMKIIKKFSHSQMTPQFLMSGESPPHLTLQSGLAFKVMKNTNGVTDVITNLSEVNVTRICHFTVIVHYS